MRLMIPVLLLLVSACESKKSTGTFGRAVSRHTSVERDIQSFESHSTASTSNKNDCDQRRLDLNQVAADAVVTTVQELVTGERAHAELQSVEAIVTDRNGSVKLIETRSGRRFSQTCLNLANVPAFNLRYAVVKNFSLQTGAFGKLNGRDAAGMRYRMEKRGERVQSFFSELRLRGSLQTDLSAQLVDLERADLRFFFLRDNSGVEIRTRTEDSATGLIVTVSARYEIKSRD